MKKLNLTLTAAAAVLMLSGCGAAADIASENNTADETVVSEMTEISVETNETEESVSVTETLTETSEITSETSSEPETEAPERRYYEVSLNTGSSVFNIDDFADKQAVETAKAIVKESERYKENLAKAEEIRDIVIENGFEFTFEPVFIEGITDDFDGDGREESFFMLLPDLQIGEGGLIWVNSYTFFSDSDGNVTLLPECIYSNSANFKNDRSLLVDADEDSPYEPMFSEIEYNGFSHILIRVGFNNNTTSSFIYSVNDGLPKFETCQPRVMDTIDNVGLLCCTVQMFYDWIAVWDNIDKRYVTPVTAELSEDEAADIPDYEQVVVIGGKYYSIPDYDDTITYLKSENGYEAADLRLMPGNMVGCEPDDFNIEENRCITLPLSEALDLNEVASEMVPLGE